MEKLVEFFVSSQGEVYFYGEAGDMLRYDMSQAELIKEVAGMIERVYPDAYQHLYDENIKSKPNKLYHKFLITDRFIRCNLGSNDTLQYDIDNGFFNIEKVNCPLRSICPSEGIVCCPKIKSPFFPKELEVAKLYATGYVARDIAKKLGKSVNTVAAQLRKMTKRLNLSSTRDLIRVVHKLNL
nr:helix-turn-helix transcriptional regulator [Prevotella sp.]